MSMFGVSTREAVFFFEGGLVTKEMLYPEFEAVLDHVVGVPDFADQERQGVFVRLDRYGRIVACVFFIIDFDSRGFSNPAWNIPLQQLAEAGGPGPDLGAGPVRLCCKSQCSAPWYQQQLWDPEFASTTNSFTQIKTAIRSNTLGLYFDEPERAGALGSASQHVADAHQLPERPSLREDRVHRDRLASQMRALRLQVLMLKRRSSDESRDAQAHWVEELERAQARLAVAERGQDDMARRNQQLREKLQNQAREFELVREQLTSMLADQLRHAESSQAELLEDLQERFAQELVARVDAEVLELREMLEMREVELFYRDEQLSSLRDEIAQLRRDKQSLLSEGADQYLHRLQQSGITFVAFHRGVGHLNISLEEMGSYLESPVAYAAEKGGVPLSRYEAWLVHQDCPYCTAEEGGSVCGDPVRRVDSPKLFLVGESDRCARHRGSARDAS